MFTTCGIGAVVGGGKVTMDGVVDWVLETIGTWIVGVVVTTTTGRVVVDCAFNGDIMVVVDGVVKIPRVGLVD